MNEPTVRGQDLCEGLSARRAQGAEPDRHVSPAPAGSGDAFQIVILDDLQPARAGERRSSPEFAQMLATYVGARVMAPMRLRASKDAPPTRYGNIIATHERIRAYTNRDKGVLPDDEALLQFGKSLFEALFQGDVRRLYDEARVRAAPARPSAHLDDPLDRGETVEIRL